jgi:hypothetical protein
MAKIESLISFDDENFQTDLIWDFSFLKFSKNYKKLENNLVKFFETNNNFKEWKGFFINNVNFIDDLNINSKHINLRNLSFKETMIIYDEFLQSINFQSVNYKKRYIKDFFTNNLSIKKELNSELIDFLDMNKIDFHDEYLNTSNEYPQLALKIENSEEFTIISNFDIKNILIHQCYYDFLQYYILDNFLVLQIDIAIGQAGALTIWDFNENKICFSIRDEGFNLINKLEYDKDNDEFYGNFYWDHPMTPIAGDGSFTITKNRKLRTNNHALINDKNQKIYGIGKIFDDEFEK